MKKLKILFLGRKQVAAKCLQWLLDTRKDVEVVGVLSDTHLQHSITSDVARNYRIPLFDSESAIQALRNERLSFDLGLSVLYWKKLKCEFISMPKIGIINFHPAPLPDFKGVGGYNLAILHGLPKWAVSAHFVDENIDTGDIIKVKYFPIDFYTETVVTLEKKSQKVLKDLFMEIVNAVLDDPASINRVQNKGGIYLSRKELEDMKCLNPATDDIDRKIRAFWFPPYDGAFIELNGKRYTLINRQILSSLADPNSSSLFSCPAPSTDEGKND
ncbi:formyltransferase family protein [Desulfobulbus oralis]|uniref:Formyl transferase N-terminal domain-containing protein n=1 Tax=Desulfobulbus oralis TaxID=1986146 RepID=A0A2L1GNA4_9BACT|nr:formyltransferase family protein [Desulfobulbus oralis]AVD71106.1 hypothetical protein CAY53_06090 [Desulfobulbus oralis]